MTQAFDFTQLYADKLPAPAAPYRGLAKYHFVGGNNDSDGLPVRALAESARRVMLDHGGDLATYYPQGGPLGDRGLREFLADKMDRFRGFTPGAERVLITSGSNHALDLICRTLINQGDTVICEEHSYSNMIARMRRRGANVVAVKLDAHGLCCDHLEQLLQAHKEQGITPKFIYAMPTVQNPTATVMPVQRRRELLDISRRYGVAVVEDECYADLLWDQQAPDSLCAMSGAEHVIHVGSFSKFLAPALRLGYITAPSEVLAQLLSVKDDAGTCSLSQMIVADFMREHYETHVTGLNKRLKAKRNVLVAALRDEFGEAAQFEVPPGGIFLWVRLPENVDTSQLAPLALAEGIAFNPGAEWSVNGETATRYLRLCYAHPSEAVIREGVSRLAQLCQREYGLNVGRIGTVGLAAAT
ncbi:MAG: PLP-dependent aminotransferase family protein [Burkholderiaceae bacterium]